MPKLVRKGRFMLINECSFKILRFDTLSEAARALLTLGPGWSLYTDGFENV